MSNTVEKANRIETKHYIVAIGASAGGLEAIHEFFDNVAVNAGLSFVIIQHLSPDYKSLLVELVSKHTHMKVFEAEDGMTIQKDCVYVIPNRKLMTIERGRLILSEKSDIKGPNTAIDFFLRTLAQDQADKAIAIILSGTGTDGTKGIQTIKEAGGLVIAQDPVTAKFDGMPNSAINTSVVDFILPPELMPGEIYNHIKIPDSKLLGNSDIKEHLLTDIFGLVHKQTGWDFHFYKQPTLVRRIIRRIGMGGFKNLENYVDHLHETPEECKALSKDFLIGVTKFFRDELAYDILQKEVFPQLVKDKVSGDVLKVWVSACSTGEEAYSLAILLDDYLNRVKKPLTVKVFATDIDENAIEIASKGMYAESITKDVPAEYLEKYFNKEGRKYQIISHIRKQIVFAKHNIIKDPPFIKNDFISCRNMLIYMNQALQKKILSNFHFSLNNNGFLFLGSSETVSSIKDKLEEVNSRWKIYKKVGHGKLNVDGMEGNGQGERSERTQKITIDKPVYAKAGKGLAEDFKEVLAEDFGYAAVYVDNNFEVKEAVGDFRKYLSLPDKVINLNLLKMVPADVAALLSTGLRKAQKEAEKVALKRMRVNENGAVRYLNIVIKPSYKTGTPYTLVVFGESNDKAATPESGIEASSVQSLQEQGLLAEIELELKETKLNLQTAIEELETTNEELQSSNEELLSANEELQSSNEELQSLNEELHTLNTEHQLKIKELIELNNDLDNYFRSNDIGQIFLDAKLRIRKFNPSAVRMINLIESDIGRPIDHISTNIRHENLLSDIQQVIASKSMIEKEVAISNGTSSLMRIIPYLLHDKKPQGVVITFVDISAIKDLNNIIKGIFNASLNAIMAFKAVRNVSQEIIDFRWMAANHACDKLLLKSCASMEGKLLKEEFPALLQDGLFQRFEQVVQKDIPLHTEFYFEQEKEKKWFEVNAVKMMDGIVVNFYDITEKKEAEEKLRKNYTELIAAKDKLKTLNKELENKVEERTKELSLSDERFKLLAKATNDAIWDWNFVNNEMWWSESFYSLFGYAEGQQEFDRNFWLEKIHADDRDKTDETVHRTINNNGSQWSAEYRFLKADGTYAQILDRGYLLKDEYGTPYRMLGSMLDITQLRQAEKEAELNIEERKFLAESIPLIVWTAKPSGQLDFLNQHFSHYTGKTIEEGLAKGWRALIHEEDITGLGTSTKEAIKNKVDFTVEIRIKRFDNEYRWHLLRARAKKDDHGNLVMWVGTTTEIHEQKLSNQILEQRVADRTDELQKVVKELEMSNIDLQQFAYVASHDLKEPLRKIHMFSHMVKDRYLSTDNHQAIDYIERIIGSSARMTKLINDLLNFSRLSVAKLFEVTDVETIIKDIHADLELAIIEKKAEIKILGNLPKLEVVPAQIRQVFQNIISNAIKFSKESVPPQITIDATLVQSKDIDAVESETGKFCRIRIMDNGIGFDQKFISKIFMIFQRLHSKADFEGTGIGLAVAKKIIEKHNGTISAISRLNEGSTFIIILPVKQEISNDDSEE